MFKRKFFRLLFLVLLTEILAQHDDPIVYEDSAASVSINTRGKLDLTPNKYKPTKTNEQNKKPNKIEEIGTRFTSCKASDGTPGNCVKADQCTTKDVFCIDRRIKDGPEEPCQDPTEVCCKPETATSLKTQCEESEESLVTEEAPVTQGVQVTPKATLQVTPKFTPQVTPKITLKITLQVTSQTEPMCGIGNPDGVGTRTKWSGDEKKAKFGEFPWTVQLLDQNKNNTHVCGGALIHPKLVVTAAHCLLGRGGEAPPRLLVRAGEWDRSTQSEELPHQDRQVADNNTHEEYVQEGLYYDIALLSLTEPFELKPHVGVVCLPTINDTEAPEHYTRCVSSGWGKESNDQELEYVLKKVELPIVDHLRCTKHMRKTRLGNAFDVHRTFLCAGGEGRDNCEGDGGAPLVCPMPDHPGRSMLTGIHSWTVSCEGRLKPGVYSHVHRLAKWIVETAFFMEADLTGYQFQQNENKR